MLTFDLYDHFIQFLQKNSPLPLVPQWGQDDLQRREPCDGDGSSLSPGWQERGREVSAESEANRWKTSEVEKNIIFFKLNSDWFYN